MQHSAGRIDASSMLCNVQLRARARIEKQRARRAVEIVIKPRPHICANAPNGEELG
jgi:hypothetical protein